MGRPAARVGDMHTCPLVDAGPTPHVGGPVLPPGAATVLIDGQPAAQVGDRATCVGPQDTIAMGSVTVWVGKKMAARMADPTAHGGQISTGSSTAELGSAAKIERLLQKAKVDPIASNIDIGFGKAIRIRGDAEFIVLTLMALEDAKGTSTGRRLVRSINRSGKTVTIVPTRGGNEAPPSNWKGALAKGAVLTWKDDAGTEHSITGTGAGSDSTVKFNPEKYHVSDGSEGWMTRPPAIGLAHELIHADDETHGRMDPKEKDGVRNYERQAVGLDPHDKKDLSENKIRSEWKPKQDPRPHY